MFDVVFWVVQIIFFVNIFFALSLIFFGRRSPSSTWVWMVAIMFLPIVGFIIYWMFGQDIKKQKVFRKKNRDDLSIRKSIYEAMHDGYYKKVCDFQENAFIYRDLDESAQDFYSFHLSDLAYHNIRTDGSYITADNSVMIYNNGEDKFDALCEDIENAKKYIHMHYYIIHSDNIGKKIINLLAKRAAEGIEVKVLYDGMGCMPSGRNFLAPVIKAGGEVANFLPPLVPPVNIRINYRCHRKLAVFDGEIGYIGGINIGDEYMGKSPRFGFWRDMHLRIEGSAVNQIQQRIIMDWNYAASKKMELLPKYFPKRYDNFDGTKIQIISSGPDTENSNIKNMYFKMINEAEKSVYFTTPYFVPDDSILTALKVAALSGIDVRLIFPGKPDHPFVYWASLSYVAELLDAGVKCYQYEKGFIHSKMIIVDGVISSIGTANMDIRSFELNFETNAIIFSKEIGTILDEQFLIDQNDSLQITKKWYDERPKMFRIKEAFSRLISPLL